MDLLTKQVECFENIKTLCTNYKKDSINRKTVDYLNSRLSSLETQWIDFHERNETLVRTTEDKEKISYFTTNVYGKTKQLYETTKANIMSLLISHQKKERKEDLEPNVDFDLSGILEDEPDEKMQQLVSRQRCNFKALERAMSKIKIELITEKWELEDHLATLKGKWDPIDKLHWELEDILKTSSLNQHYAVKFDAIERNYDTLRKQLNNKIWSNIHYQQAAPKIDIQDFHGDYIHWISFKNLFLETIHKNPTISKSQKMQHLKTKLKGEAERLVQHLTVSAENYDSCWEILSHRYDNRRLQFTSFLNAMQQLPVIQYPNTYNLKKLHDVITESLNGLANMEVDVTSWGPMIVHYMSQKLDTVTFNEYSKEVQNNRELPDLTEFLTFLESKFMAFETIKNRHNVTNNNSQRQISNMQFNKPTNKYRHNYNYRNYNEKHNLPKKSTLYKDNRDYSKTFFTAFGNCPLCDGNHVLMQCAKFVDMDITQRNNTVAKLKVCKNCLYRHENTECNSRKTCKECNSKHHTLLHNTKKAYVPTNTNQPSTSMQQGSNHLITNDMEVLLTTVQVKIKARDGTFITLRALLDQGSQVNLITENAAQLLRLPRNKFNATVSGVGSVSGDCKGCVQLTCKSIHNDYTFNTQALVMKKLTNNIPNCTFPKANWPHLQNLKLGDPDFNISSTVDLLFSADVYAEIIMDGVLKGDQHSPVAQQTQLGWILCGKLQTLNCHLAIIDLADISKYWDNEDITQGVEDINKDDHCENYYNKTTKRGSDGKYIVKMPMKENFELQLGKSKPTAVSQYLQLEKRLAKNTKLSIMYKNFINEYSNLQHMKPSSPISKASESQECYLPHHGVLRENSITTKLRVVFNASSKTSSGKSLNDLMEKGPNLQKDIQSLILKWRSYKYAFTADIEKMYRCIWISADQQHLQKIIWRPSSTETLQEYTLRTLTYGTKCAPWLAMRTLKQLAMDDGHKYPAAADTLKNEFYVDDLISGYNSLEGAKELQTTLIRLLKGGGFNLRKWSSNCPELLENLTEDQISTNNTFDFKQESTTNTLGLGWNPNLDAFIFNWNIKNTSKKPLTKRILLSEISQLYDPLGWLSPVTITAKIIFQRVWELNLGWDEQLPAEIQNDWLKLREQISVLKTIKINRWIGGTKKFIDLYGFCDASEKAYACIVYTRVINENGEPVVNLLTAKTRVAPLAQKITLPRLELCGALLLSQLMEKAKQSLNDYILTIWAWSDSKVVLAWLQGEETKWERYVENRVKKIKQVIPPRQWSYIESKSNPADCATRGVDPKNLLNLNLWWNGPEILKTFMGTNDKEPINCLFTSNIDKKGKVTTLEQNNDNIIVNIINKCSSLTRVKRIVAWIMRFIKNIRNNSTAVKPDTASYQMALGTYLTASELLAANKLIIRFIQRKELEMEYNSLTKKQFLNTKSPIYKLYPYLDEDGIIRVGGRLNKTNLPLGMKNPIILPRKGKFTQLIIEEAHATTLHGGARLTLAFIRQRYWIVGGNRAVKTQLRHCVRCLRYKTTNNYQLMADLPPQRAIPSRPFTHTGVDFTGHVDVKLNKGRGVKTCKGYIAIFVCMATKAVHIELVSDLSTHTFIAALQRLCARRGTPKHMYSDCGTNFIGASKVLKTEFELFKTELPPEFFDEIVKMEIEWHFNAPAWPSAGGLWEAAVRSMKQHLHRILGDQKLTYEEFTTLLTKIEACMNSRPICPLTEDPEEFYSYLTPGHFLTGSPMLTLPLSNYEDERNLNLRQRWQLTEHMMQRFWKLWSNDYLTQLQARSKWQKPTKNMAIGDIVLVKENNLPPGKWAMGRVIDVHPGEDGHVRVTTVKTQSGVIKRPIVKLSKLLPMEPEDMENETVTPYSSNVTRSMTVTSLEV